MTPPPVVARPRAWGLAALHGAHFTGVGIYMPFFPLWLGAQGLDAAAIGFVLAVPIVVRIVVTAPLMSLADARLGPRALLVLGNAGLVAVYVGLLGLDSAWSIGVAVALMALFQAALIPMSDLLTTDAVRLHAGLDYGRIRVWGSIAFLVTAILGGYGLGQVDVNLVPVLLAASAAAAVAVALLGAPARRLADAGAEEGASAPMATPLPRTLWLVIGAAALVQASHTAIYGFGSVHWRGLGFPEGAIGLLWATGVLAEIVLFALLGRVVRLLEASVAMIALGALAAAFRFGVMALDPGLAASFALQVLHGFSFGATHLGTMGAATALAPAHLRGRVQGLLGSAIALAMAAGTVLSGFAYSALGPGAFAAMVPVALAGLALALVLMRRLKAREGQV